MATQHTPRSAAMLLTDALAHIDRIQPASAREPVRQMLRAGIETCASSRSLAGKPVQQTLALAQALTSDDPGPSTP
jgi:hypothetical protein